MAREKVLRYLQKKGFSIDERMVPDRQMTWPQARQFVRYVRLCVKHDDAREYWTMLAASLVFARAPRYPGTVFGPSYPHPYAELMGELYTARSERYGHRTN